VPRPDVDFRAVVFLRLDVFRLAVLRVAALRGVDLRAVVFRAVVFRAVVFRAVVLRAVVLRAVVLRAAVFRALVVFFLLDDAARPLDELLRDDEAELRDEDEPPDDDFVSPAFARCLFTVRAAISLARPVERPCFFSESLMCSYWRSRFELHAR
jgi:hypothetical protein